MPTDPIDLSALSGVPYRFGGVEDGVDADGYVPAVLGAVRDAPGGHPDLAVVNVLDLLANGEREHE